MLVTISIPTDGKCLLKSGQNVSLDTPYLEKKATVIETIPAASILGIAPAKIFNHLRKFVGDDVKTGDLIGVRKSIFSTKKITSKFNGVIQEIDHHSGHISIRTAGDSDITQKTFFKGEISEVKKQGIVIDLDKARAFPLQKAVASFGGEVGYSDFSAKIFLSDSITPYRQSKAEAIGATGFVTLARLEDETDLPVAQLKNISDYKKIVDLHHRYCLIIKENSTIYFYE